MAIELEKYRKLFPISEEYIFFNHAGIAPANLRLKEAVTNYLDQTLTKPISDAITALVEQCRKQVAFLINANQPDEIALLPGTTTGINVAANSLPLKAGDNVLVVDGDYPADIYPWYNLAPKGILVKVVPRKHAGIEVADLEARVDNRTRVVALGSAIWGSGYRLDLKAIGAFCKERGIYFVVDGMQTVGAFPLDVQECQIDFLACGSHKWLLGTPGSGFLYCRHSLLQELQLGAYVGAASTVDAWNFLDYNFTLQPSSQRFVLSLPNYMDIIALNASLELILEVGIANISKRLLDLSARLIEGLETYQIKVLSNPEPSHRSGSLMVGVNAPEKTNQALLAHKVIVSVRAGGLRVSPHFYNTEREIEQFVELLVKTQP